MAGTGWDQVGVVRVLLFVHCNYADWDLEVCLNYECRRKQIRKPSYFNQWIDVRATYKVHVIDTPKMHFIFLYKRGTCTPKTSS